MSYGGFNSQISARGAVTVERSKENKSTTFEYDQKRWQCEFKNQTAMAGELADGCEMAYCLAKYCIEVPKVDKK